MNKDGVRAFIAILISRGLRCKINLIQEEFKKVAPRVKWVARDNIHITLKFLGDVQESELDKVRDAIAEAVSCQTAFEIELGDVGAFPNVRTPRTVWIGVKSGAERLETMAKRIENSLEKLGFPKENRPFRAHITIGRVKDNRDVEGLPQSLRSSDVGAIGSLRVDSIALMKSDLKREGPLYTALTEFALKTENEGEGSNG